MIVVLYILIGVQYFLNVYIPLVSLYMLCGLIIYEDISTNLICYPIFRLKRFSIKVGFILWMIQILLLGVILWGYANWILTGESPLLRIW